MWVNLTTCKSWDKSLSSKPVPIILTSYHRPATFKRCVNSLVLATHQPIYIIDNSQGQLNAELAWAEPYVERVIRNPTNIGKPASIRENWGLFPESQWFVTMDPDIIIPRNGIDQMIDEANRLCETGFEIGIMTPALQHQRRTWAKQLATENLCMHNWAEMKEFQPNIWLNSCLAGCLMLVNRLFYEAIGGFPGTRLYNDDDGWLCNESKKQGLMNVINSNLICQHDRSEEDDGYLEWKERNSTEQVDPEGYWD